MLPNRSHWHFAFEHHPERERRLAFAKDKRQSASGSGNEDDRQREQGDGERPDSAPLPVEHISGHTRSSVEHLEALAESALQSEFVLEQATDILRADERIRDTKEAKEIITLSAQYVELTSGEADAEAAEETRKRLLALLAKQIRNHRIAGAFAAAFENRRAHYDELIAQVGESGVGKIAEIDRTITDEARRKGFLEGLDPTGVASDEADVQWKTYEYGLAQWNEARIDTTLTALNVPPASISIPAGADAVDFKRGLLLNKIIAARKLAILEQKDMGGDSTLSNTDDVRRKFETQQLEAKKNLERRLAERAAALDDRLENLRKVITEKAGSNDLEAIAKRFGISTKEVEGSIENIKLTFLRVQRTSKIRENEQPPQDDPKNLPDTDSDTFMRSAEALGAQLDGLSWLDEDNEDLLIKRLLGEASSERKAAEAWAAATAERLSDAVTQLQQHPKLLEEVASVCLPDGSPDAPEQFVLNLEEYAETAVRVRDREATPEDLDLLRLNLDISRRKKLDTILLAIESPTILSHMLADKKDIANDKTDNTEGTRTETQQALGQALKELQEQPLLRDNTLCKHLPINEELGVIGADVLAKLQFAKGAERGRDAATREEGKRKLRECRLQVKKMRDATAALQAVHVVEESLREGKDAEFRSKDNVIALDASNVALKAQEWGVSDEEARTRIVHHEEGHAIVDALVFRTGLMPKILGVMHLALQRQTSDGKSGWSMVDQLAGNWHVDENTRKKYLDFEREKLKLPEDNVGDEKLERLAAMRADARVREHLMDEALNRYATWDESGRPQGNTEEAELCTLLAEDETPRSAESSEATLDVPEDERARPHVMRNMTHDDDTDDSEGGSNSGGNTRMIGTEITEAQNAFVQIRNFISTHQNTRGVGEFTAWVDEWEAAFTTEIKEPYYGGDSFDENIIGQKLVLMRNDFLSEAEKKMEAITSKEMDTTGATGQGQRGLLGLWNSIDWVSINDIIQMCQSGAEDIKRMWKRRGERVQSTLGQGLTKWIPRWVPYAGQLENEFRRREQASELGNVKVWKDAYENLDPHDLEDLLGNANDKDQVRAIVELLISRGHLGLNNQGFWRTLSKLSGITIPTEAMAASDIVRDFWLQKMVSVIWSDKHKFFEWKQDNSAGIKKGKDQFTPTADQLANIKGGLRKRLSRQLEQFVEAHERGDHVPDEVDPHLYEELLHYSMRNGQMTMEDKMFFLVQGIRYKLLSIDRLRALAGQSGGIVNQFPMIDYFKSKHNTYPEILALGKRLDEAKSGSERFSPGQKTTLWLHLEVLRDEGASSRISKASSGTRAEDLDHEDIPTIMAQADYETVKRMTDIISGGREKLSPEAVKNGYTGFGTKFKILARLAELGKFTQGDAMEAAKSVTAYILYDNIVTRNGADRENRSTLSWANIQGHGPSTGKYSVQDYRIPNNTFVKDLISGLGTSIDWAKVGVGPEQFVRSAEDISVRKDDEQSKNFKGIKSFEQELSRALADPANRQTLTRLLVKYADKLHEENGNDSLTRSAVEEYFKERSQHEKNG